MQSAIRKPTSSPPLTPEKIAIQTLAKLIRGGKREKEWSNKDAAAAAVRLNLGAGYSARNIALHLAEAKTFYPKERIIRGFATLFGQSEDEWLREFVETGLHPLLLDMDTIMREQERLTEEDEVSIISSYAFLEAGDSGIGEMVLENLDRGIIYKYFFPAGDLHPYGVHAEKSYLDFLEKVDQRRFQGSPLLFGYPVDPKKFGYFSALPTIVRYKSQTPGVAKTYVFIGLLNSGSGHVEYKWYILPEKTSKGIEKNLKDARSSIADLGVDIVPRNARLRGVRKEYVNWFQQAESVAQYSSLRPVLGHAGDRCLQALMTEIGRTEIVRTPIAGGALKYLDVGCGDGGVTRKVADYLAQQFAVPVTAVGLDASGAQLRSAEASFKDQTGISFSVDKSDFEEFNERQQFHLVTAIHSFYTIDEAYVRRIYELLKPGGIGCIWMAMRQNNVVTSICEAVDSVLRPGQRRNVAEDVERYARGAGLSTDMVKSEGAVAHLVDSSGIPTDDGRKLIEFCALQPVTNGSREWDAAVGALRTSLGKNGDHPLTDGLVVIQRHR